MHILILVIFGVRCFVIQRGPSITLQTNNAFQSVQKLFPYSAICLVGYAESFQTSGNGPSTSRVMNIPRKRQSAMLSSNLTWKLSKLARFASRAFGAP